MKHSLKLLYLKSYKWLLSQKQRVRNDFFWLKTALDTGQVHQTIFKKNTKVKGRQCPDYNEDFYLVILLNLLKPELFFSLGQTEQSMGFQF